MPDASLRAGPLRLSRPQSEAPLKVTHPITLDLTFKNYMPAELLAYLHSVKRVDAHSIQFVGQDTQEISDFIDFVDYYNADLTP